MPGRILIVDDDAVMLQALTGMVELRLPTVIIETCESATAALERIGDTDYDAIVSDVKMPGMDGFQLMARVLILRPTTPTLLVTGHGDHDMGVKALNAGAYAFIPKPIDRDFFLAWLKRAIQLRQLSRSVEQHTQELKQTVKERTAELQQNNLQLQTVAELHRESETLYRSLAEAMPQIVYMTRPDGATEYVNEQWVNYTGVLKEEALKHEWTQALHPEDVPVAVDRWTEAVREGRIFESEYRLRRADGDYRWHLSRALPMRDQWGHIVKWIGTSTDIHSRKRSEEALRDSEDRYKRLVKYSPDAILINRNNRIVFVNEAGLALFGASHRDQLIGKSPFDLFHPECHPLVTRRIKRLREGGESLAMGVEQIMRLDGAIADVEVVASTFLDRGDGAIHLFLRNITERKRADEALRESEERFRTLADHMSQFAWMADATGWIFWYNRRWFEYTGTALEEMRGWGWKKVHHPDHVDRVVARIQRSWDTGEPWEDTFPLRGTDGNYRWFLSRALPIRDAKGQIIRWFGTNTDVTEQRAAEEALRNHEQQLKLIADTAPVYIAHCDTEGRYKFVNKGYAERLGVRPEDCLGKHIEEVVGGQAYQSFHRYVDAALSGQPVEFEVEVPYEAIGRRFMHCSYVPERAPDGTVRGLVAVITDVTSRRQVEEALQQSIERLEVAQEAGQSGTFEWNIQTNETKWSAAEARLYGLEPGGLKGQYVDWRRLIHPDDVEAAEQAVMHAVEQRTELSTEFRIVRPDGAARWIFTSGRVVCDDGGTPLRMIGVNIDITERKQAEDEIRRLLEDVQRREQELRDKQRQLVQAAKLASIGELASGVAHELNNPLNNIGLFVGNVLHQMEEGELDPDRMRYNLQTALQQVNKAAAIITHLRTFARTAATQPEPVFLYEVIHAAASLVEAQLRLFNIQLALDLGSDNPMVLGNAIQLEQVFINLLTNARDAIEGAADKRITIRSHIHGTHIDVAVSDTGFGISPEQQARIFDPFFTTKEIGKGTGLGLSISYGIIKDHHGRIDVESQPGKGATFVVRLPLTENSAEC